MLLLYGPSALALQRALIVIVSPSAYATDKTDQAKLRDEVLPKCEECVAQSKQGLSPMSARCRYVSFRPRRRREGS